MKRCLAVSLLFCAPITAAVADPRAVSEIVAMAEEHNAELRVLRRQVRDAQDDLSFPTGLRDSYLYLSTSLSSSYDTWSDAFGADASASIPFLRQLSLGARVSSLGHTTASLTYSPFVPSRSDYLEKA